MTDVPGAVARLINALALSDGGGPGGSQGPRFLCAPRRLRDRWVDSARQQVAPEIEYAVDLDRVDEGVEGGLGPLIAHWVAQNLGGPLDALANAGPNLGVVQVPLDDASRLARVGHCHEAPQVAEVFVADCALAWLTKPLADLRPLGKDERGDLGDVDLGRQAGVGEVGDRDQ